MPLATGLARERRDQSELISYFKCQQCLIVVLRLPSQECVKLHKDLLYHCLQRDVSISNACLSQPFFTKQLLFAIVRLSNAVRVTHYSFALVQFHRALREIAVRHNSDNTLTYM